jgi:16S rRNA A1518/A1519 N6-dimethyltransferase RsmA/KsgA/DIM1 with predicted DNA glycosylase/AP lyase activity
MATATLTRVDELAAFKEELRRVDLKVDSDFQKALQAAQRLLEMSDREIGDALSVSRPSVNRWMNGANLPYNAMRKVVFNWIEKSLTSKMRTIAEIERSQRSSSSSTPVAPLSYVANRRA